MSFLSFRYKFPALRASTYNQRKGSVEVTDEEEEAKLSFPHRFNRLSVNMYSLYCYQFKSYGKENNIICESVH